MQLIELCSKANSKSRKETTFLLIVTIGGTLLFLIGLWILTDRPPHDWRDHPQPPYHIWVALILVIGVAVTLVYIGYVVYKVLSQ